MYVRNCVCVCWWERVPLGGFPCCFDNRVNQDPIRAGDPCVRVWVLYLYMSVCVCACVCMCMHMHMCMCMCNRMCMVRTVRVVCVCYVA